MGINLRLWIASLLFVAAGGCRGLGEAQPAPAERPDPSARPALEVRDGASAAPSAPRACAASRDCASGERCSVEDGACLRPPGCGPSDPCAAVCYGECLPGAGAAGAAGRDEPAPGAKPTRGPSESRCASDADCTLHADQCTGCDCRALGRGEPAPRCEGPGVRCLVDPCMRRRAACVEGRCAVVLGGGAPAR